MILPPDPPERKKWKDMTASERKVAALLGVSLSVLAGFVLLLLLEAAA